MVLDVLAGFTLKEEYNFSKIPEEYEEKLITFRSM
jgi:hypothetical protein